MVSQRGCPGYNMPGCSLVHRRLAEHSDWMTWSSHPAPDEYIDHVSQLPVSVAIYHYDDFVEITKA